MPSDRFNFQVNLGGPLEDIGVTYLVADVNGDGIPDICIMAGSTVEIYVGLGGATYAVPFSIGTGPSPRLSTRREFT